MNTRPHKLEASIGGYPGPYYDVTLTDGELIYDWQDGDGRLTLQPEGRFITPTKEARAPSCLVRRTRAVSPNVGSCEVARQVAHLRQPHRPWAESRPVAWPGGCRSPGEGGRLVVRDVR